MNKSSKIIVYFGFLICISSIPLGLSRIPPLVDYPNHLARVYVLSNIDDDKGLQKYYEPNWGVLPNLAMDILVPPFMGKMSPYLAGRFFILMIFFLLVSGTCALHYALHGRFFYWPLLSVLFLYNRHFLWGFLNFSFGIGLCLWILAFWISSLRRPPLFRLALFSILSLLLFFSHLYAFGIYGLCIVGLTLHSHLEERSSRALKEWGIALGQFILPAVLFIAFSPTAGSVALQDSRFGDFSRKLGSLFQAVNNYNHFLDGITFAILAGLFLLGMWLGKVRLNGRLKYSLLLLALFFLFMPEKLLSVHAADTRIPTPFVFLLLAGSNFYNGNRRAMAAVIGLIAVLFIVRMTVIGIHWNRADQEYALYRQAILKMDENSRLFTAIGASGFSWQPFPVPLRHLPCIAIIDKSALVPSLFANESQQPVRFTPFYRRLVKETPGPGFNPGRPPDWGEISEHYEYVLVLRKHLFSKQPPAQWKIIDQGENFSLLQVPKGDPT